MKQLSKNDAIDYALDHLNHIDKKYKTTSAKTSQYIKVAKAIHAGLLAEDKDGNYQISENTYHNSLTAVRNAIKSTGRKHPALLSKLKRKGYYAKVLAELPEYKADLELIKSMPASTIALGKANLKKKLHDELSGSKLNKAIELIDSLLIDHPLIGYLTKPKAMRESRQASEAKALTTKSQDVKIYNFPKVLELAIEGLESDSYTTLAWSIALLTGRRSIEILRTGTFKKINKANVMFSGQAKKREGVKTKAYKIPVLHDADEIIKALDKLRSMHSVACYLSGSIDVRGEKRSIKKMHSREINELINQRTNGVLNDKAKSLLNDKAEVFKNTRGIYARHTSDTIRTKAKDWKGYNEDEFLKAVLGHASTEEIQHYRQVELKNEPKKEWLKVAEKVEKKTSDKPKKKATRNTRAGVEIRLIGELINELDSDGFTMIGTRKVKHQSIKDWHNNKLSVWAYENSKMKITQSAIEKNKGNTAETGTGTVDVRAGRAIFKAWSQVAGDLLEKYNARKD